MEAGCCSRIVVFRRFHFARVNVPWEDRIETSNVLKTEKPSERKEDSGFWVKCFSDNAR